MNAQNDVAEINLRVYFVENDRLLNELGKHVFDYLRGSVLVVVDKRRRDLIVIRNEFVLINLLFVRGVSFGFSVRIRFGNVVRRDGDSRLRIIAFRIVLEKRATGHKPEARNDRQ